MIEKDTATFGKNRKRRFRCRKCKAILGSKEGGVVWSYMGEKKVRMLKCKDCGYEGYYSPPEIKGKDENTGRNIIYWEK